MSSALHPETGLGTVAEALVSYLLELDEYRAICLGHEASAVVEQREAALRVEEVFDMAGKPHRLLTTARQLPGWDISPFWGSEREAWRAMEQDENTRGGERRRGGIIRGVVFRDRPMLLHAREDGGLLRLSALVPPLPLPLPDLPLRTLATALSCLDRLAPSEERVLSPPRLHGNRGISPSAFLRRTMPKNLVACQCIFGPAGG
jgi:hypothetical protein